MVNRAARVGRMAMAALATALVLAGLEAVAWAQAAPREAVVTGRNVNMVSGTKWPGGDPYLQRQNEPTLAASSRNPLHLLGGANDYRTVDLPFVSGADETGDAWLGVFKSFDGGQRWRSDLLPGYPQDVSPGGVSSPLHGYQAGADPVVRAGANGLLYYAGIVFDRAAPAPPGLPAPPQRSAVFVSRFIDNNNVENADSIAHLGTALVSSDSGATGRFLDKPWLAVDAPRGGAPLCRISTPGEHGPIEQTIPAGTAYVAFTVYSEDLIGPRAEINFSRSTDCGATWSAPIRISRVEDRINQGATIAIDPRSGAVYVAWRRIASASAGDTDAILVSTSETSGRKFSPPGVARRFPRGKKVGLDPSRYFEHRRFGLSAAVDPDLQSFDQATSDVDGFLSFRTNAYPSMTVDGSGRVYLAWAERGLDPLRPGTDGDARIAVASSIDGSHWSPPSPVAVEGSPGHQIMPTLTFGSGRLALVYYDLREDASQLFTPFIDDKTAILYRGRRHTLDLRTSFGTPGDPPVFLPSARVSDFMVGTPSGQPGETPYRLQYNAPNLPMFKQGTSPFMGDYVDVTPSATFVRGSDGQWRFDTAGSDPVFHAVWTDNRDVRPPADGDWRNYTPPTQRAVGSASVFDPSAGVPACNPATTGSRNQNIYTAPLTTGLVTGSPSNAKPLSPTLQRAFVVFAQNTTDVPKAFRLSVLAQPLGGHASFDQFDPARTSVDVTTPPRSMAARSVYVTSTDPAARIDVAVAEIAAAGAAGLLPNGLTGLVVLNPDAENPAIMNPAIMNPAIMNPDILSAEVYNPAIMNPAIMNPAIMNPAIMNPDLTNPAIMNPDIVNPAIMNPDLANPDLTDPAITNVTIVNPAIMNPAIMNPAIMNPAIMNPDLSNPAITNATILNGTLTDVTWTITNTGNTTAVYNVDLFLAQNSPKLCATSQGPGCIATQLIVRKVYTTPVASGCTLQVETHNVLVTNITNPKLTSLSPSRTAARTQAPPAWLSWHLALDDGPRPGPSAWMIAGDVSRSAEPAGGGGSDPNDPSADNASLWLAPGETAQITLRIIDPDRSDNVVIDGVSIDPLFAPTAQGAGVVVPVVASQTVNTPDAEAGATTPTVVTLSGSTIVFLEQPTGFISGTAISPVVVQVRDSLWAPRPGVPVTIALGANPGGAVLGGTLAATTDADGNATFANLTLSQGGSGYTLVVTAGSIALAASSKPFDEVHGIPAPAPMPGPRYYPGATLLDDGRVLVAGGNDGVVSLDTAAVFAPATGAWATVPAMGAARALHTTVKLADGRVLVAGGQNDAAAALSGTERFDPVSNTWSPAAPLTVARTAHVAVRLIDGRVLVAGGLDAASTPLASAELYNPTANTWTLIAPMSAPRYGAVLAVLSDGRVMVAGGQDASAANLSSAEAYDPSTGTWTALAPMAGGHSFGSATTLVDRTMLVLGGESAGGVTARAERFDPVANTWTTMPAMASAREDHQATLLPDGRVFVSGGLDGIDGVAAVQTFDPVLSTWASVGSLAAGRFGHVAVRMQDGRVLIAGGFNFTDGALSSVEIWNPGW